MIPGPDQIISCPKCKGLAKYMTLVSGNTFGARIWTDGKKVEPMLPIPPAIVKCRHCGECYWLAEAKEVGTVTRGEGQQIKPDWVDAEEVEQPTEEEYYQALEGGLALTVRQERNVRVLAWWRRNDAFRDIHKEHAQDSVLGLWRKNLEALVSLLTEDDDNDHLMRAEVLRELGEFESAKEILSHVNSHDVATVVSQLRSLCDTKDASVRELHFST